LASGRTSLAFVIVVAGAISEVPHADVRDPWLVRGRPAGGDGGAVSRHRQSEHLEPTGTVFASPLQPEAGVAEIAGLKAVGGATPFSVSFFATRHRQRPSRPSK
jgi:hypothetical protein